MSQVTLIVSVSINYRSMQKEVLNPTTTVIEAKHFNTLRHWILEEIY